MELVLSIVAAWGACGVAAWLILAGYWWRRDMDLTVGDAVFFAGMSLLGPICLIIALVFAASALLHDAFASRVNGEAVVWRRSR